MAILGHPSLLQTSPIVKTLARFLHWWRGELATMLPERLRFWWGQAGQAFFLSIEEEHAKLSRPAPGHSEPILDILLDHNALDKQGSDLTKVLVDQAGKNHRVILSLPATLTLRRTLKLPLVTEENLAQTLVYELDRFTPFKADEVVFAYRILHRDLSSQIIAVDVAIVRRSEVDRLTRLINALGLPLHGLAFQGEIFSGDTLHGWRASGTKDSSGHLWIRTAGVLLSILLLVAFLGIPIWQKRSAAISLIGPLAESRDAAKTTDALRDRLDKLIARHNALPDKKWSSPSLVQVLDEVSLRLKDDTFVMNCGFDGKAITLQGESGSGAELVEVLEASPLFHNVMFKSPLTKLPSGTHDRFHIGADISPEGMPKPSVPPGAGAQ